MNAFRFSGAVLALLVASPAPSPGVILQPRPELDVDAGERDPFSWPEGPPGVPRAPGLAGVSIREALLRGIVLLSGTGGDAVSHGALGLLILESPMGAGFVVAPGDRLRDGFLERVEAGGAVFREFGDQGAEVFRPLDEPGASGEADRRP